MSEGGENSSPLSSQLAAETPDGGAKESNSAANVTAFGNHATTHSDTNVDSESGQQASSPNNAPPPRRLFPTTGKKTGQSKRDEHPSNTPNHGKTKKKQNTRTGFNAQKRRDRSQAQKNKRGTKSKTPTSPNGDDTEAGGATKTGYTVPNKKFEQRIRTDTFRGREVAREEFYDTEEIAKHDQSVFDAANNAFGHHDVKLGSVSQGFLTNDLECLSRLHVEDILTQCSSEPIHFRVLISKESKKRSWAEDSELIFEEQQCIEGLGVQKRKIMKVWYYELYAELIPNRNFKLLQQKEMQQDEFLQLFLDESVESNNTFELKFEGLPDDDRMKFKWSDMVGYAGDLLIFGKRSSLRSYQNLFTDKTNVIYIHHIYRQFCRETCGDVLATFALTTAYHRKMSIVSTETAEKIVADTVEDIMKNKMTFIGREKSAFFEELDTFFKNAIEGSIAQFRNLNDPLVPQDVLIEFMDRVKSDESIGLTHVWQALSNMRAIRSNETRSDHLVHSKEMQVFFQLLSLARQADPQRLIHWAFAHALAFYGWGIRNKLQNLLHYWGFTCSTWNRDEKMQELLKSVEEKQRTTLSLLGAILFVFDNVQRGKHLDFQREGKSSDYVKGTQHLAIKIRPYTNKSWNGKQAKMTYDAKQPFPSPAGFPAFESLRIDSISDVAGVFVNLNSVVCQETPDFEGTRVAAYNKLRSIAHVLKEVKRCFWPDNVHPGTPLFDDAKINIMQTIVRSEETRSLFEGAKSFQGDVTEKWNPEVGDVTMAMMLGVSGLEEETGNQCGAHQLDELFRCGILIQKADGSWGLREDYINRHIYVCGDAKTTENLAKFDRDLSDRKLSYDKAAEQAAVYMDARSVVIDLPGDWHAGLAMLKAIYTLFYDGFLKPFQEALGWKRINLDVGACYFQAVRLAGYTADELTRLLMYEYVSTFNLDDFDEADKSTYNVWACKFAVGFKQFLNDMKSSTDELRRACALYLTMYTRFRMFVDSYRSCDAVGILSEYNNFLPVWHKLGMNKYFERALSQNEQLLRDCNFDRYMEASKNRCVRVHDKESGKGGIALDEFLELQNANLAEFQPTTNIHSYIRQGKFVGSATSCKSYVSESHRTSTSAISAPKRSVEPSTIPEKQLIFEYFVKLGVTACDDTRKYSSRNVYQTRLKLTTVLTRPDAKKRNTSSSDHSYNRIFSSIQQILSSENDHGGDEEDEIDEDEVMRAVRENLDEDDNNNTSNETETVGEEEGRLIKFRNRHKLMLHDLESDGWKSISGLNLKEVREARAQREERQKKVKEEIANYVRQQRRQGDCDIGQEVSVVQPWKSYVQRARSDHIGEYVER